MMPMDSPFSTVRPGDDELRLQDSLEALRQGNKKYAKLFAMMAGVNAANLGKCECPELLSQQPDLADQWQWGNSVGTRGSAKVEAERKEQKPMWWQKD